MNRIFSAIEYICVGQMRLLYNIAKEMRILAVFDSNNKWGWFILAVIVSFIPVFLRLLVCLSVKSALAFDIKDFLGAAIAMNLSNLNLIGHQSFKYKSGVAVFSALLVLAIGVILALFLHHDLAKQSDDLIGLTIVSVMVVAASLYVSYEANEHLFEKKAKKV